MGQGAGRPAAPARLTLKLEDGLGQTPAGSFLHGLVCLETAVPLEDTPVIRCEVTCIVRSELTFALEDDRIANSAARRAVPVEMRRVQSHSAVLLRDMASASHVDSHKAQTLEAGSYQWPLAVQLPDDAPPTIEYRGVWLGSPNADVTADVSWAVHVACLYADGDPAAEATEPLTVLPRKPPAVAPVELWNGGHAMRSSCCGLWRTGRLRGRLRFEQPSYSAGDTAVLLLDAHNKSLTDITEIVVVLRRKLCIQFADDGGPSWTTSQHGKRAGSAAAETAPGGGVLEHYEEVLLSQSELGLSAGAYAWNFTARRIELPLSRDWPPSCDSDAVKCHYAVDVRLLISAASGCGCCSDTLSHVGLPLTVLPRESKMGGASAKPSVSTEPTQVFKPLVLHPRNPVDTAANDSFETSTAADIGAMQSTQTSLRQPLLEKG